jgi:hypothetical protein
MGCSIFHSIAHSLEDAKRGEHSGGSSRQSGETKGVRSEAAAGVHGKVRSQPSSPTVSAVKPQRRRPSE